jgi:hypothetical protein
MEPEEWSTSCTYGLLIKGVDPTPDDPNTGPPADLPMTLNIVRDSENVYLGFLWTHDPGTGNAYEYLLGMGFDFNHNGVWQDPDGNLNTVDDAMLLVYLGVDIGQPNPPPDAWVKIFIPDGAYVLSWGEKSDGTFGFDAIAGPPGPEGIYGGVVGPVLDRDMNTVDLCPLDGTGHAACVQGQDYGAGYSPLSPGPGYEYVLEFKVPKAFFNSPAGFGFALTQNGDGWTWPGVLDASKIDLNVETSAEALGVLGEVASGAGQALLDPGPNANEPNGPNGPAVGGVTMAVDKVAVLAPWIAGFAMLGIAVLVVATRKRRT